MPEIIRRHVIVSGSVQGVFFRQSTCDQARAHGVCGWVRNRPDGSVEAVFEGSPDAVEAMAAWCAHGPPMARVTAVEASEEAPEGLDGFVVR